MAEINTWPGWEYVRQLGSGSFGKVYEIQREEFGKIYKAALKVITIPQNQSDVLDVYSEGMDEKKATEYFRSIVKDITGEFALMSELKGHSNIVSYEDHMVIEHSNDIGWDILIRMELLIPLQQWSVSHPFTEAGVIALGCDICRALELCQKKNILHRDIKPENIFVNEYGNYKLGDFGIARTVEKTMSSMSQKGTYTYMAPEVYLGHQYGATVDIYSLGTVLYRYLNDNRTPFLPLDAICYTDREKALTMRMRGEPIPEPLNGNQKLKKVVLKALAFKPEERFASAVEFRHALEECVSYVEDQSQTVQLFLLGDSKSKSRSKNSKNVSQPIEETKTELIESVNSNQKNRGLVDLKKKKDKFLYEKKMVQRKDHEKNKRDNKMFKIVSTVAGVALGLAIVIGMGSVVFKEQIALYGTYIQVGDRNISKLEYDFYYNTSVNDYLSAYGFLNSYIGLDTTRDFADQPFDENLSWKDMFDQMTVQQIVQTYAIIDNAKENDFEYDDTADYEERIASFQSAAEDAGVTESEFYKITFGEYATKSNLTPFIKDQILATAYYNYLKEVNAPSEEKIASYYNENSYNYDKVDYRSFVFATDIAKDASKDDVKTAMEELKEKADNFKGARTNGSNFEQLCIENAPEKEKANYEDKATEYSLKEGQYRAYTPSAIASWLYDNSRKENDIEVIEDTDNHCYYVVEFVRRYCDERELDAEISDLLSSDITTEYISHLMENYEINDPKGKLKYLTVNKMNASETKEKYKN